MSHRHPSIAVVLLVAGVFVATQPRGGSARAADVITVNASQQYQTMTGWEANAWAAETSPRFPALLDATLTTLVNEVGINRLRVQLRSGQENSTDYWSMYSSDQDNPTYRCLRYSTVNDNADPFTINPNGFKWSHLDSRVDQYVVPMRQKLQARGETLHLNLQYTAFTNQITGSGCPSGLGYVHDDPNEYAEFVLAAFQHLKTKYNLVPDSLEIMLEPDNSAVWKNAGHGTFVARALVAVNARLAAANFHPKFIAPSNSNLTDAISYFDQMVAVSGAAPLIWEYSYHRYGGVNDTNLQAIGQRAAQHGIKTSMLEHINSDYQDLYKDITIAGTSGWQQYAIAGSVSTGATLSGGGHYVVVDDTLSGTVGTAVTDMAKLLSQCFRYVRYNARRVAASSTNGALEPLAFVNADGRYAVVVEANGAATFSIGGITPGTYGISYTTNSAYAATLPDVQVVAGGSLTTSIPAGGVLTVFGKTAGVPPPAPPTNVHVMP